MTMQEDVTSAAERVDQATAELGAAFRQLTAALDQARSAAWDTGGARAVEDINARAGADRVAIELAGAMQSAGLTPVLGAFGRMHVVPPVTDFAARWATRAQHLTSSRPRDTTRAVVGTRGIPERKR